MKKAVIAGSMVAGLLLGNGVISAMDAANILGRVNRAQENRDSDWVPSGPTKEDILSANKVENQATQVSPEDKLLNAVKNGKHEDVEALIAAKTGLEARDNENMTALMKAAEKGDAVSVRMLVDAGADVSAQDKYGSTALFKAAEKNHVAVVTILMAKGAGAVDKNFKGVFVASVFKGNVDMVKALMVAEVDEDILDAAYTVVNYGNRELVNLIKEARNKKIE